MSGAGGRRGARGAGGRRPASTLNTSRRVSALAAFLASHNYRNALCGPTALRVPFTIVISVNVVNRKSRGEEAFMGKCVAKY